MGPVRRVKIAGGKDRSLVPKILSLQTGKRFAGGRVVRAVLYPSLPRFETISVNVAMAISAERDQICICVVTQPAAPAEVVNLKTI